MRYRFLLDGMLGALVRWLRICGYETKYLQNVPDEELIKIASLEGRILLTKDNLLYRKAVRAGIETSLVDGQNDAEKLASVASRYGIKLEAKNLRCTKCDAPLVSIPRREVRCKVPPRTFQAHKAFWICSSCRKVYWKGSHWTSIENTVKKASHKAKSMIQNREHSL